MLGSTVKKQFALSIFDQARLTILGSFYPNKRIETLVHNVIDGLEFSHLEDSRSSWQALFAELDPGDFQFLVKTLDEVLGGRGVKFEMAMMPGNGAKAASVYCISITVDTLRRAVLIPLVDQNSVGVCKLSAPFLGTNFWMEPVFNESPELAFRRIVGMLSLDLVTPPPMTALRCA